MLPVMRPYGLSALVKERSRPVARGVDEIVNVLPELASAMERFILMPCSCGLIAAGPQPWGTLPWATASGRVTGR